MSRVAVVGLGRFGMALARELAAHAVQVIAIDRSPQLVQEIKDAVDIAVRLDATDARALESQDISKVDVCVIAIGEHFESALLTTVLAKKLGVPRIVCRAQTEFHAEIFRQIGCHEVSQPETEAGKHLAHKLINPRLHDVIMLADGFALIELPAPAPFWGKSLEDLALRRRHQVNLVAIKRPHPDDTTEEGETSKPRLSILSAPGADDLIQKNDVLVLVGPDEALARLAEA